MNIYLSQPITGIATSEYLTTRRRLENYCRAHFPSPITFINSYITQEPPADCKNKDLWYIGQSIDRLSRADVFVILKGADTVSKGCYIEKKCAEMYGIPVEKASIV